MTSPEAMSTLHVQFWFVVPSPVKGTSSLEKELILEPGRLYIVSSIYKMSRECLVVTVKKCLNIFPHQRGLVRETRLPPEISQWPKREEFDKIDNIILD